MIKKIFVVLGLMFVVSCGELPGKIGESESNLEPVYDTFYKSWLELNLNTAVGNMPAGYEVNAASFVKIGQPSFTNGLEPAWTAHRIQQGPGKMSCAIRVARRWGYPDPIVPSYLLQYGSSWQEYWSGVGSVTSEGGATSTCTITQPGGGYVTVSVASDSYRIYRSLDSVASYHGVEIFRPIANGYVGTFRDGAAVLNNL